MDYRITNRVRTHFMDDRGVAVPGYRVYFVMEDSTVDYIEIPKPLYNAVNVTDAIEAAIKAHLEVMGR